MSSAAEKPLCLMLVCGEPSGDQLGAQLMAGLKEIGGDNIRITGVGGPAMTREGLKSLFSLDATSVMGLREVVPRIPAILARVREASDYALSTHPDALVLIDSPDFTHRIGRRVKKADPTISVVNYVAPQVWASRSYRAKKMARYIDMILALLPFEAPFFEKYGIKSVFTGHPVLERKQWMKGGADLRARLGVAPEAPLLCLLPGSRMNEIRFLLEPFRQAVALLAKDVPGLVTVLPTVPHVAARVREGVASWPTPLHIVESEKDKYAAFDAADVALAASGTVTTELALARTPMVVAYILGWLTYAIMRPLINAKWVTLVNLLLDREAVPEFIQEQCTPEALAGALKPLFLDKDAAARQIADLEEAGRRLGEGGDAPSLRAAQALIEFAKAQRLAIST